jgi:hypothetical protein
LMNSWLRNLIVLPLGFGHQGGVFAPDLSGAVFVSDVDVLAAFCFDEVVSVV